MAVTAGAAGPAFVTPHAVQQFQCRVAPLPYHHALAAILHGLQAFSNVRPLANGTGLRVRVRRPYAFRAIIKAASRSQRQGLPVVVTILRSGS